MLRQIYCLQKFLMKRERERVNKYFILSPLFNLFRQCSPSHFVNIHLCYLKFIQILSCHTVYFVSSLH